MEAFMEVHLQVHLVPGYRPGLYALDVIALHLEDGKCVAQRALLSDVVYATPPTEDTEIRLWAIALLRSMQDRGETELLRSFKEAPESLTVRSFKPNQI
jgi:hypothetical protein